MTSYDLLIIGAGPTGLAAACEAVRHGLSVRIVDEKAHRSTYSKALVVHARTLETFESMGIVAAIRAAGIPFAALNVTPVIGQPSIRIDLMHLEWGDTRYPYWLSIPQYETERCLEEHLAAQGVSVAWEVKFSGLVTHADYVEATLTNAAGAVETCRAKWLIGCDGGRSPVRAAVGLGFDSASLDETFIIADAIGNAGLPEDEGATVLAAEGLMFVVPMPEPGRWRVIAHLANHPPAEKVDITPAYVDRLFAERLGVTFGARDLSWTSQFVLKQGVAQTYRAGRVFIAGDAAHLHSPVGGQGLNTGAQDAFALIWRLALVERSKPRHEALLDSYEAERRAVAQDMVSNTSRATKMMTLRNGVLAALRGAVAQVALRANPVQQRLGRSVGMLDLAYPDSPIILSGPHGDVGPGDRLPDPASGQRCLCDLLDSRRHSVLVLDETDAGHAAAQQIAARGLRCIWVSKDEEAAGVWRDAEGALKKNLGVARLVIVRPDRVIAAATPKLNLSLLDTYAERLGVMPAAL